MIADQASTYEAFIATLKRDLLVAFKRKNDIVNPFMFFIIVCSLFPLVAFFSILVWSWFGLGGSWVV